MTLAVAPAKAALQTPAMSWRLILLAAILSVLGCGTRSYEQRVAELRHKVRAGHLDDAAALLDRLYASRIEAESGELTLSDRHGLLWLGERAQLELQAERPDLALPLLRKAVRRIDRLRAADLVAGTMSAILNDTVRDYVGSPPEHHLLSYQLALAEWQLAQRNQGLVREARSLLSPELQSPVDAAGSALPALDHYDRTVNAFRYLTRYEATRTRDSAGLSRFRGMPFLYAMAAASVLAHPQRSSDDLQYARVCLATARRLLAEEQELYAGDRGLRWEAAADDRLYQSLEWRVLRRQDPLAYRDRLAEAGLTEAELLHAGLLPLPGQASLLIVEHIDWAARSQAMRIRLLGMDHSRGRGRGQRFAIGSVWFAAEGPGAETVRHWPPLPLPPEVARAVAPGGATVISFELPAHRADQELSTPPWRLELLGDDRQQMILQAGPLLCDVDGYIRAELRDLQPQIVLKTLIRVAVKQAAVAAATREIRRAQGDGAGLLAGLAGSITMSSTEHADLRAMALLPNHIRARLVDLPAGTWQLRSGEQVLGHLDLPPESLVVLPLRGWTSPD